MTLTSPADGSTISGQYATIFVLASDSSGIDRVEIYVDGKAKTTLAGAGPSYTYSLNIKSLKACDHVIKATAYVIHGNSANDSNTVTKAQGGNANGGSQASAKKRG